MVLDLEAGQVKALVLPEESKAWMNTAGEPGDCTVLRVRVRGLLLALLPLKPALGHTCQPLCSLVESPMPVLFTKDVVRDQRCQRKFHSFILLSHFFYACLPLLFV